MKKLIFGIILFFAFCPYPASAQSYDDVLNYYFNGTPVNGVKIKTTIPFQDGTGMPTIIIEGYNYAGSSYGTSVPIGLSIVWYAWAGAFINYAVSSWGAYTPPVYLSDENGFICIFINDKTYFQRFKIRAYAVGQSETASWFQGWTVADEPLGGTKQVLLPYVNSFGKINVSGNIVVNNGNVLIGKTSQANPAYQLDVNGNARMNEIVVNSSGADFVFDSAYRLPSLSSLENYIKQNKHLPSIAPAKEMQANGANLGANQMKLLQKVEELTLYLIKQNKDIEGLKRDNAVLKKEIEQLKNKKE